MARNLCWTVLIMIIAVMVTGCTSLGKKPDQKGAYVCITEKPVDRRITGYRGVWFDLGQNSTYGSKYSGGLGTYTAKHRPLAHYVKEVDKTFFVYGGTKAADQRQQLSMAGYFDHKTGKLSLPKIVHENPKVRDPHDNPSMQIDSDGYLWVFVSGRARTRLGHTYRSMEPYSIDEFELLREAEYAYPQPWYVEKKGFLKLFTKYTHGRELYWSVLEKDKTGYGGKWSEDQKLAGMDGHYQVSNHSDGRIITAFNMHPRGNVDKRTNLYYVETDDMGNTWRTAEGETVCPPLEDTNSPALVRNYKSDGRLVYLKDIIFDEQGRPVILYITSMDHRPGPVGEQRRWTVAHWKGDEWVFHNITRAWHNYDMGSLYIEEEGWRLIAPTEPGPQRWGTGGEIAIWFTENDGKTWEMLREVTVNSPYNHAYVRRPVNAHTEFYGFWADGSPDKLTRSRLYFTNRQGDETHRLPYEMISETPKQINYEIP